MFTKSELQMLRTGLRIAIEDGTLSDDARTRRRSQALADKIDAALGRNANVK